MKHPLYIVKNCLNSETLLKSAHSMRNVLINALKVYFESVQVIESNIIKTERPTKEVNYDKVFIRILNTVTPQDVRLFHELTQGKISHDNSFCRIIVTRHQPTYITEETARYFRIDIVTMFGGNFDFIYMGKNKIGG